MDAIDIKNLACSRCLAPVDDGKNGWTHLARR